MNNQSVIFFTVAGQIELPVLIHSDAILKSVRELTTLQYHLIPGV